MSIYLFPVLGVSFSVFFPFSVLVLAYDVKNRIESIILFSVESALLADMVDGSQVTGAGHDVKGAAATTDITSINLYFEHTYIM